MKSRKVFFGLILGVCVCLAGGATAQNANYQSNKLVEIGPDNIGGRVTSLVIVNGADNQKTLYAGAASGGVYTRSAVYYSNNADDIWEYIPCYVNDEEFTLPVSAMLSLNDDLIVVGTGEGNYEKGNKVKKMAALGRGIFLFNPSTKVFTRIESTNPGTDLSADFAAVNRIAAVTIQGTTYVYVATNQGLFRWAMPEASVSEVSAWGTPTKVFEGKVRSLVLSKQFNRAFFTSRGDVYKISDMINGSEPVNISGTSTAFGQNTLAVDLALAPTDESYLYAMAFSNNGLMKGLYLTRNTNSWQMISTSTVTPFNSLATAKTCGAITVSPRDPSMVFLGGASIYVGRGLVENSPYQWTPTSTTEAANSGDYMASVYSSSTFVHSGIHQIVPDYRWIASASTILESYYVVTDGGIYFTPSEDFFVFQNINKGLNNVQINSVAVTPDGSIISGANSNACPMIESRMGHFGGNNPESWYDPTGSNTNHKANILWRGNGGAVAASRFTQYQPISRRPIFVSSANGAMGRAYGDYSDYTNTQTWNSDADFMSDRVGGGPEIGQMYLWETDHNTTITDSLRVVIDTLSYVLRDGQQHILRHNFQVQAGDSMMVLDAGHAAYPFWHAFDHGFKVKDELVHKVHAPYVSRMLAVTVAPTTPQNTNVSYCWTPTDFRRVSSADADSLRYWSHIYHVDGPKYPGKYVRYAVLSADASCAIIAVEDSVEKKSFVVRVKGLNDIDYTLRTDVINGMIESQSTIRVTTIDTLQVTPDGGVYFDRRISSLSIDPREGKDVLVLTFDCYGNEAANVVYIDGVSGDNYSIHNIPLPTSIPVYSSLVEYTTGALFVGTEEGVFKADNYTNIHSAADWSTYGSFKGVPVTSIYQVTCDYPLVRYTGHDGVEEVPYIFPRTKWSKAIYFGTYGRGIFMDSSYVVNHENEILDPRDYTGIPTVTDNSDNVLRFYPNPVVDNVTMELSVFHAGKGLVKVYDLTGKVVMSENLGTLTEGTYTRTFDLQRLQSGMYLVNVVVGGQVSTSKLIVR